MGSATTQPAHHTAPDGWESLTSAELRVVRLVVDGLTNRQVATELFLSPHTVDSHLRRAYAKLGVTSRVALTRLVVLYDTCRRHADTDA